MPADAWTPGGKLFFKAKPDIDDDNTDAAAVISQTFDDGVVSDITINGVAYKRYTCYFPPSATNSIVSDGSSKAVYKGEWQWVDSDAVPHTFPGDSAKLKAVVYFDVVRKIT